MSLIVRHWIEKNVDCTDVFRPFEQKMQMKFVAILSRLGYADRLIQGNIQ